MKKIDKIKEYFLENNINNFSGCYCNFPDGPKARFTYRFYTNLYDDNTLSSDFIICLKKENTSYFVDFLNKKRRYQKIGDFKKGETLANEIGVYYDSRKYTNFPDQFVDPNKQRYSVKGRENIRKYFDFWNKKLIERPECSENIKDRLSNIDDVLNGLITYENDPRYQK